MNDLYGWVKELVQAPWMITTLAVIAAYIVGRILVRIARPILAHLAGLTASEWDDRLVQLIASPISLVVALQALRLALPWLPLHDKTVTTLREAIAVLTTVAALWTVFRAIDLAHSVLQRRSWAVDRPSSRSLLSIGSRFAKVIAVVVGGILGLAQLGVSVASLVAGLGIGGLAVALAAQKTLENLFGTLSIGVDQPMREGDFVKLYDITGTVEQIGLRSTRIRTLDRTIVTIPNGDLANQRIESYTVRDRLRLAVTIGLVYATTSQQMRAILGELEAVLRRHPKIWPDGLYVRFKDLAASSLDVEINAWFATADWNEFIFIKQDMLLEFMAAIERCGSQIAFPTRTLHLAGSPAPAPGEVSRSAP